MSEPFVYLVGAGPGDPGLITVRGRECLARARCVVYDALVSEELVNFAPAEAERIYVGKRAGSHAASQEEINELLVEKARALGPVCRLKGGDPFVFGRGAEEALHLAACGIPFEVVPGVTSATAAPAYAGIPVTHRGLASSFAVVTGHEDPRKARATVNWSRLALAAETIVVLMGVGRLEEIASALVEHGRAPETPAALVRWATLAEQQTLVAPLGEIAQRAREAGIAPPAVLVVGEVVRLREKLRWFERRPLFGKTVVVTRARAQAGALSAQLRELGARVIEAPAIRLADPDDWRPLDEAIAGLGSYHYVVFTSANGVEQFWRRLRHGGKDARALFGKTICCIGRGTAAALKTRGIVADVVPERFQAEGLVEALEQAGVAGKRVLVPRAEEAREVLEEGLARLGAEVHVVPAYKTLPAEDFPREKLLDELRRGGVDVIAFMSSGTARRFFELLSEGEGQTTAQELVRGVTIAAIGPVTAATLAELGAPAQIVAREATVEALVRAIVDDVAGASGEGRR